MAMMSKSSTSYTGHIARIGINYHFPYAPAPVVPRQSSPNIDQTRAAAEASLNFRGLLGGERRVQTPGRDLRA